MKKQFLFLFISVITLTGFGQIDVNWLLIARNTGTYVAVDGYEVRTMGFTPSLGASVEIPGPTLRATTGDSVKLRLFNLSQHAPHTIHLHGLDVNQANDGVPSLSFTVPHDSSGYYYFKAPHPGTYLYHCHVVSAVHVQGGMYGMIIIDAEEPTETWEDGYNFTSEYIWMTSEIDTIWHNDTILEHEYGDGMPIHIPKYYDPQYFLVNGAMDFQMEEKEGINIHEGAESKILLRLANIGNLANKYTFPEALGAQIISSDGRPLPTAESSDSLWIHPGERYQVLCNPLSEFIDSIQIDYLHLTGTLKGTQYVNVKIEGTYGIQEDTKVKISLYPNPAQNMLEFNLSTFSYQLYSIDGQLVETGKVTNGQISVDNLSQGHYLIAIDTAENESQTLHFIKH